jgi:hypothetical protein
VQSPQTGSTEIAAPAPGASAGWAVGAWLAVQLAALGLCAVRAAFWARAPHATEQLALYAMLAVQVGVSAILFPLLLRNLRWMIFALVTAWPLGELAGFLADVSVRRFAMAELFVSLWLVMLYFWSRLLRTTWMKVFGAAIGAMLCLGGPLLWYLRLEFRAGGGEPQLGELSAFGPITAAISQSIPSASRAISWGWMAIPMIVALLLMWRVPVRDHRHPLIHK